MATYPKDSSGLSWREAKTLLREFREENVRQSDLIVDIWERLLRSRCSKMGDEGFLIQEQVCMAAADINRPDIVDDCLHSLSSEFPGSSRVKRLQILKLEMAGKYEEALAYLDETCKLDETNPAPRKKRIAILKAIGDTAEATKELAEYVKIFMSDRDAWQELSELYIADGDFTRAAFCQEELMLINPHNHLYHQRYAEIRYTMGGADNMDLARSHYCLALKLCPSNMRALYGVLMCASNTKTQSKKKDGNKLASWALEQLKEKYEEAEVEDSGLEGLMSALQIAPS